MSCIQHEIRCKENKHRIVISEEGRKKLSELNKEKYKNPLELEKLSKAVSKAVRKKVIEGTWHTSLKNTSRFEYKGIKVHGTWELEYVKWLDKNNIKWRRVTESFKYTLDSKERRYTPDFYLIEEKCYIEVKGYETEKDKAKWECFPKGLKLVVLKKNDLIKLGVKIHQ